MIIDFDHIEENVATNFKGGEGQYRVRTFLDEQNRIMRGLLQPGSSIGMHSHEKNSEIYYILSGKGKVVLDGKEEETLVAGQMHYCPMGHAHCLINDSETENLVFLGIVAEHHD